MEKKNSIMVALFKSKGFFFFQKSFYQPTVPFSFALEKKLYSLERYILNRKLR